MSAQLGTPGPDIVTIPDVSALPPGAAKDTLTAAGIRAWACVPLIRPGRVRGIMGFDASRPIRNGSPRCRWCALPATQWPMPSSASSSSAIGRGLRRGWRRARRMQMIGSLASGIAHNFNNIIGAILGYSEMVEPQLSPGTKPAQHIDEIRRAAERGRDLIDNILTFGRQRDSRVRPVQVRTLFEEAASLLRASLPSGVELIIDDVPVDVAVSGEPALLQQVILNLCTNAAQAMEGSGKYPFNRGAKRRGQSIILEPRRAHARPLRVPSRRSTLGTALTKVWRGDCSSRFSRPVLSGTGLGLATVHEIVRDLDGAMNVQSEPGHGSRFEAWLPATAADSTEEVGPVMLPLGRGETVLVVESEHERLLRDEEMLAALGYEPVGFERPADAIAACRSAPDRFDIILVSYASQTWTGLDLARTLHEIAPRPRVLLATASTIHVSVDAMADTGISEVLRRPLASSELAAALARCLHSSGACYDVT